MLSGFEVFGGLAVLLSFKCPFAERRVASAYLRGGSLANGGDAANENEENNGRMSGECAIGTSVC